MTHGTLRTGALAAAALFGVELAYLGARGVPSVDLSPTLSGALLLQSLAFAAPLALCIAGVLAGRERLAQALAETKFGRIRIDGTLQTMLLGALLPLLLISTPAKLSALTQVLYVAGALALCVGLLLLRRLLQCGGPATVALVAHDNITAIAATALVLWFLHEGNLLRDLHEDKFGLASSMNRQATLVTAAVPVALFMISPTLRGARAWVARRRRFKAPAMLAGLAALALLQHLNTVMFPDSYAHYHRVLSLVSCIVAVWVGTLASGWSEAASSSAPTSARAWRLALGCGLLLPTPTLWQHQSTPAYVAAIHTVWLRLGYDITGPVRSRLRPPGKAPPTHVAAGLGPETVAFERKPRDVVLFLLDGQRAEGYALHGPPAAHIPRTARCFEGAFELRRAFTTGTSTEVAYPALHSSTHGVTRGQVRHHHLASEEWLAEARATSLSTAMSRAGHRTVLLSEAWYLDMFFDPPRWSTLFGRYDEVLRARPQQSAREVWDAARVFRTDDPRPLLLVVHIGDHGLNARPAIDETIGTICDAFAERGRLREAVLLLTADHGWQHFEHGRNTYGRTLFNEEARVPLFVRLPGLRGGPRDFNVSFVDQLPTLLDAQGYPIPPSVEGQSYLPLLLGAAPNPARPIFMETRMAVWGSAAVVRGDLKLIRWHTPGVEAMFDLRRDPGERRNVLGDPSMQREAAELRGWLDAFLGS